MQRLHMRSLPLESLALSQEGQGVLLVKDACETFVHAFFIGRTLSLKRGSPLFSRSVLQLKDACTDVAYVSFIGGMLPLKRSPLLSRDAPLLKDTCVLLWGALQLRRGLLPLSRDVPQLKGCMRKQSACVLHWGTPSSQLEHSPKKDTCANNEHAPFSGKHSS